MPDISDAESAFLQGRSDFETWKAEFMRTWYLPIAETVMSAMAVSSPGKLDQAVGNQPDLVKVLEKLKASGGRNANHV